MGFTNLWPLFLLLTIPPVIMLYILKRKYKEEVIPQIIRDALYTDLHSEDGDRMFEYSATRLCKSPRQLQLEQRHAKEMDTPEIINIW